MSEPTYTITITESERAAMAQVFGGLVTKLANCRIQIEAPTGGTQVARAILSSPAPSTTPPAVTQSPAPILEQRDRWATDKAGNPYTPTSKGVHPLEVHIWKLKQTDKYLRVTWQNHGAGYGDANCFDPELWPWLAKKQGEMTRLYVTQSGNYTNIVGVCA